MKINRLVLIVIATLAISTVFADTSAKSKNVTLTVTTKQIVVDGKKVTVNTIVQPDGTWGYYGTEGDDFNVTVKNDLTDPTVIHWHGLLLPNKDDGTELTQANIEPGKSYDYDFKLKQSGTFWMHSHYGYQEQTYVDAPLIIYPKGYDSKNDVVIMFQDFSFKKPETIMKELRSGAGNSHGSMDMGNSKVDEDISKSKSMNMDMAKSKAMNMDMSKGSTGGVDSQEDLNDVKYDAFLTNYKTTDNPEVKKVVPGETYRLRFINGSSSTNFWINLGDLKGTVVAVDGNDIVPIHGNEFQLAIAQRMDIEVTIPNKGVFPIIGQVEGKKNQTGIILTTTSTKNLTIDRGAKLKSKAFSYDQLKKLHAKDTSTINTKSAKLVDIKLTGDMQKYVWQINGQEWPNVTPI